MKQILFSFVAEDQGSQTKIERVLLVKEDSGRFARDPLNLAVLEFLQSLENGGHLEVSAPPPAGPIEGPPQAGKTIDGAPVH